jgi:hypothetical protein
MATSRRSVSWATGIGHADMSKSSRSWVVSEMVIVVTLVLTACLTGAAVGAQEPSPSSSPEVSGKPDPQACADYWAYVAIEGSPRPYGDESLDPEARMEDLETCVVGTDLTADNQVVAWEDPINGLVCIQARWDTEVRGSACTLASATDPMVSGVGTVASEPILMLVVDAQHRLGGIGFERDGESLSQRMVKVHQPIDQPGLALAAEVDVWPDTVRVFDTESNELLIVEAHDLVGTGEEFPEEASPDISPPAS